MGTTSDKLTYLNTTKGKIKDVINMIGANITSDTTFRNYATKLYDGYVNVLKDKNTLLDNMPKGTSTGAITDAANLPIYEDKMSKESSQDGTPTPENPVEVKTVKGYRNLFDKDNLIKGWIRGTDGQYFNQYTDTYNCTNYIEVTPNTTYTINLIDINGLLSGGIIEYDSSKTYISYVPENQIIKTFTTSNTTRYIRFTVRVDSKNDVMLNEGNTLFPYVPYGTNWIYTAISNGNDTNYYTIPLNENEICGIGDYKDELIVDKNGKCWLNKKIGKKIFNDSDTFAEQYSSSSRTGFWTLIVGIKPISSGNEIPNLLSTKFISVSMNANWKPGNMSMVTYEGNLNKVYFFLEANKTVDDIKNVLVNQPIYYPLATPQLIDLNYTVDIELFNGVNNISNSDDMDMEIKYVQDINAILDKLINGQAL